MNNQLTAALQQHKVVLSDIRSTLRLVRMQANDLENIISNELLLAPDSQIANDLHNRYVNLENQLRYFLGKG